MTNTINRQLFLSSSHSALGELKKKRKDDGQGGGLNVLRRPSASQTSECGERDGETMPLARAPHGSICLFSARYLWRLLEMQRGLRVRNAAPRVSLTHFPSSHPVSSRPAYVCVRSRKRILARHLKKKKKRKQQDAFIYN